MSSANDPEVLVEVSAKHIHLSEEDAGTLFGSDHEFQSRRRLKCDGAWVTSDSVEIHLADNVLKNVRIVMPFRKKTKVELSATDIFKLTRKPIFCHDGSQKEFDIVIVGPKGSVSLCSQKIVSCRHLHASPSDAENLGLKDGDVIKVLTSGPRSLLLNNVLVRVEQGAVLTCHLDTDEGHAAGISREGKGVILRG